MMVWPQVLPEKKKTNVVLPWVHDDGTKTKEIISVERDELNRCDKEGVILRVRRV
jgi:hypothetical protein